MEHLKISIVTPSFNQGVYIEETIRSVLSQDYPSLEYIIIDGQSSDNSVDIIRKYESRLTFWESKKDSGQSEAINKGFQMASGDIITWICSDDLLTPGSLFKINETFKKIPPDVGLVHGNSVFFNKRKNIRTDLGYDDQSVENALAGMTFAQPSSFFRKSLLEKTGMLQERLHFGMDYDLFSKISICSKFYYENFTFSKYRLHSKSKSTTSAAKFIEEWIIIFNSILLGLDSQNNIKELKNSGLERNPIDSIVDFHRNYKGKIAIDHERLLYNFLVNVFRYDYITENFERAKQIAHKLNTEFKKDHKSDPAIEQMIRRSLIFPSLLLKSARMITKKLYQI